MLRWVVVLWTNIQVSCMTLLAIELNLEDFQSNLCSLSAIVKDTEEPTASSSPGSWQRWNCGCVFVSAYLAPDGGQNFRRRTAVKKLPVPSSSSSTCLLSVSSPPPPGAHLLPLPLHDVDTRRLRRTKSRCLWSFPTRCVPCIMYAPARVLPSERRSVGAGVLLLYDS